MLPATSCHLLAHRVGYAPLHLVQGFRSLAKHLEFAGTQAVMLFCGDHLLLLSAAVYHISLSVKLLTSPLDTGLEPRGSWLDWGLSRKA